MRRLASKIKLMIFLSVILVSPMKSDAQMGINIGDSFQLTIEFKGDLKQSYRLPYTNHYINDREQPLVADYTIENFLSDSNNTNYIEFSIKSEIVDHNHFIFTSPLDLIESYILFNNSYFEPPPVISLDFQGQFDRLFTYVNNDIKTDNETLLIDFGYTNDLGTYEIYFSINYSSILDTRSFQAYTMRYNKKTGILESFHSIVGYKDGDQLVPTDEVYINNTTPLSESSTSSTNSIVQIISILVIISASLYYFLRLRPKRRNLYIDTVKRSQPDLPPTHQITDHYETLLTQRSEVKIKPQIVKAILCPVCNTVNMMDSKFCLECGTYISA